MAGCLKRYTDPSSLRKHVKNHTAKALSEQGDFSEVKSTSGAGRRARRKQLSSVSSSSTYEEYPAMMPSDGLATDMGQFQDDDDVFYSPELNLDDAQLVFAEDGGLLFNELSRLVNQTDNDNGK